MPRTRSEAFVEFRSGEILDTARRVFARRGFEAATVDEVAEAAGITRATVYQYFASKRELFFAALRQGLDVLFEESERRMAAGSTARERLRLFIETRLEYFERNRDFFRIYCCEMANLLANPERQGGMEQFFVRQVDALEAVLRAGVEGGEIRDLRTRSTAVTIYDMTRGVVTQRLLGWSTVGLEQEAEELFDLIWRGIRAETGRRARN